MLRPRQWMERMPSSAFFSVASPETYRDNASVLLQRNQLLPEWSLGILESMGQNRKPQPPAGEAKRPNSRLAVNDGLFRAAFRNSPAMHSIVRFPEGVLVEVNESFTRTLGYTREEVIG